MAALAILAIPRSEPDMRRAPRPCVTPGCPNLALAGGRCATCGPARWSAGAHGYRPAPNWPTIRARVLTRDGGRCQTCGTPATEVDHIVPVARGGTDELANLRAICPSCHRAKTALESRQ